MNKIIDKADAIQSLGFNNFHGSEGKGFVFPNGETPPSDEEIETKRAEMELEWTAQEYARKRQAEYPSIEELTVALYDTDDKADIEAKRAAVKAKFPKPE
jgi:hypothetical protein